MKAVITVTGKDAKGIIAAVSNCCADHGANIVDISQSVLQDYFAMIMLVEVDDLKLSFTEFVDVMQKLGDEKGLVIHTMHEDIFNAMHRI
ncbi:MAG: ACT domain-containing protein [Ruminococcaceae bacterium]|nr:ACT domain-containing protein [Oscillospiraceae bacterium]